MKAITKLAFVHNASLNFTNNGIKGLLEYITQKSKMV